jgi:hypothetical protein
MLFISEKKLKKIIKDEVERLSVYPCLTEDPNHIEGIMPAVMVDWILNHLKIKPMLKRTKIEFEKIK